MNPISSLFQAKKVLVLDFDHTAGMLDADHEFNWKAIYQAVEEHFSTKYGVSVSEEQPLLVKIKNLLGLAAEADPSMNRAAEYAGACKIIEQVTETQAPRSVLFDEAIELMEIAKARDMKVYFCSHNNKSIIERVLRDARADHLVDGILALEDADYDDPGMKRLDQIAQEAGVGTNDMIFIGDHYMDSMAARTHRVDMIGLLSGHDDSSRLVEEGALFVREDLKQVLVEIKEGLNE